MRAADDTAARDHGEGKGLTPSLSESHFETPMTVTAPV